MGVAMYKQKMSWKREGEGGEKRGGKRGKRGISEKERNLLVLANPGQLT